MFETTRDELDRIKDSIQVVLASKDGHFLEKMIAAARKRVPIGKSPDFYWGILSMNGSLVMPTTMGLDVGLMTIAGYYRASMSLLGIESTSDSFDAAIHIILSSHEGSALERVTEQTRGLLPRHKSLDFYRGVVWMAPVAAVLPLGLGVTVMAISAYSQATIEILEKKIQSN